MIAGAQRRQYAHEKRESAEHRANETSLTKSTEVVARFTKALVFVGLLSAGVSYFQWREMHSGGDDTHTVAQASLKQAEAASKQAEAASKQADAAVTTAAAATKSAVAAENAVKATLEIERPRLIVANATLSPDNSEISFAIQNIGRTAGVIKLIYAVCDIVSTLPTRPTLHLSNFRRVEFTVVPNAQDFKSGTAALPNCKLPHALNPEEIAQISAESLHASMLIVLAYEGQTGVSYSKMNDVIVKPGGWSGYYGGINYNHEENEPGYFDGGAKAVMPEIVQ